MNQATVRIGDQFVGDGHPVFIVAEIGINHNGVARPRPQADRRRRAGRLRRGEVPEAHAGDLRPARPVGHRARHPLGPDDLHRLPAPRGVRRGRSTRPSTGTAASAGIHWFASLLGRGVGRLHGAVRRPPATRSPRPRSPTTTLLRKMKATGRPLILSTGMSTWDEIEGGVAAVRARTAAHRPLRVDLPLPGATSSTCR